MALTRDQIDDLAEEGVFLGNIYEIAQAIEAEVRKQDDALIRQLVDALDDAARHFFDAGWKACANFCDRDDVRFDGIVGHRGCPQFDEAFRAARKQGGA